MARARRREMASPSPVPPCRRRTAASACSNSKNRNGSASAVDADAGILDRDGDAHLVGFRRTVAGAVGRAADGDQHAALVGELDGVADQVGHDLAQPHLVAQQQDAAGADRSPRRCRCPSRRPSAPAARRRPARIRRPPAARSSVAACRPRSWRSRGSRRSASAACAPIARWPWHRSAAPATARCRTAARSCRECRSSACGSRGSWPRGSATWRGWQLPPAGAPRAARPRCSRRSVMSRPRHCTSGTAASAGRHDVLLPFEPARPGARLDLLHVALLAQRERPERAARSCRRRARSARTPGPGHPALEPEHPAERLVDEGQPALGVAPQDHVGLVVEQIAVARFVLADLPLDVLERLEAALETIADVQEALELGLQIATGNSRWADAGSRSPAPVRTWLPPPSQARRRPDSFRSGVTLDAFFYCRSLLPESQSRRH